MAIQAGEITVIDGEITDTPRRGRPPKAETELKARVEEIEARQAEIIDVLAGTSQAGGWLKDCYARGVRA